MMLYSIHVCMVWVCKAPIAFPLTATCVDAPCMPNMHITHSHIHMHTHAHTHTHTYTYTHTHTLTHTHAHTRTHSYVHTYIHTYIHTHTYTQWGRLGLRDAKLHCRARSMRGCLRGWKAAADALVCVCVCVCACVCVWVCACVWVKVCVFWVCLKGV
jgi:hypothetical protein